MKIAIPVKNGYVHERLEDARFFAILLWDDEKVVMIKIIKVPELKGEYEGLIELIKDEGVDTLIVYSISVSGRESFRHAGIEVICGAMGDYESLCYEIMSKTGGFNVIR